jgi:hypothetical protein
MHRASSGARRQGIVDVEDAATREGADRPSAATWSAAAVHLYYCRSIPWPAQWVYSGVAAADCRDPPA